MQRQAIAALAALALVAPAGGCGGDGEEGGAVSDAAQSAAAEGPVSQGRFLKRANGICAQAEGRMFEEIQAYEAEHPEATKEAEAEKAPVLNREALVPVMQDTIDQLRGLGEPPKNPAQYATILAAMQRATDSAARTDISELYEFGAEFKASDKLAVRYGLDACTYSF